MTIEELARLGREMRRRQQAYFDEVRANRRPGPGPPRDGALSAALVASKSAERDFDRAVDAILDPQPGLFARG